MLRVLVLLLTLLTVSGCGGKSTVTYTLSFDTQSSEEQTALSLASIRVIERRLERIGELVLKKDIVTEDGTISLSLVLKNPEAAETLTRELIQPFSLAIMEEAPEAEAETVVAGHGGFRSTGITQVHLKRVDAGEDIQAPGKGQAILFFTEEGREHMTEAFRKNKGKAIGLFIRGKLVSKLLVETDTVLDTILIREIPSVELASIFADDVNVGLHVTFTPAL